jgi:hypothetical protein
MKFLIGCEGELADDFLKKKAVACPVFSYLNVLIQISA